MYDLRMARAFTSLQPWCPRGFGVDLIDNNEFITIRIPSDRLMALGHDDKRRAVEYVARVKDAFEGLGAIVLVICTAVSETEG